MADAGFIETNVDRLQDTLRGWTDDIELAQKDFEKRRKRFEKDAEKRVNQFRKDVERNEYVKRAMSLRKEVRKQVDERVVELLGSFQIASQADVKKLERKVAALTRRVKELEEWE